MVSTLTEQIAAQHDAERNAARATYVAILHRADTPKPGDTEELASVCAQLGLEAEQFNQDAAVVADFNACIEKAAAEPEIRVELKRVCDERSKMRGGVPADPRARVEAEKAYKKIVKARTAAQFKLDRSVQAKDRAEALRKQHWFLMGTPELRDTT